MSTIAKLLLETMSDQFDGEYQGGKIATDTSATIAFMTDNSVSETELCGQQVWVMGDGSYITRNDDLYYEGDDVTEFELVASSP